MLFMFSIFGIIFVLGVAGWAMGWNDPSMPIAAPEVTWKEFFIAMVTPSPPQEGLERWKEIQLMQPAETRTRVVSADGVGGIKDELNCFGSSEQTMAQPPRPKAVTAPGASAANVPPPPPPLGGGLSPAPKPRKSSEAILGGANAKPQSRETTGSDVQSDTSSNDPGSAKNALRKKPPPTGKAAPSSSSSASATPAGGAEKKKRAPPPTASRKSGNGYGKEDVQLV